MLIAKVNGNEIIEIADYKAMFPNTSFPESGPEAEWYSLVSCLPVCVFVPYDSATQQLEPCTPYIQDGVVYTVHAVARPEPLPTPDITINTTANDSITLTSADTIVGA